jgi:hypothetical protein
MTISFSDRVTVPDDVLISQLQEESVILNLDSERYYGLDDVGTRFYQSSQHRNRSKPPTIVSAANTTLTRKLCATIWPRSSRT